MTKYLVIAAAVVVALTLIVGYADVQDNKNWHQFSSERHCRETGRIDSSTALGYSMTGHFGVITTPAKSTFTCDGGYTVTRDAQ